MLRLSLHRGRREDVSSSDSEDEAPTKITAVPKSFTIRKKNEPEVLKKSIIYIFLYRGCLW